MEARTHLLHLAAEFEQNGVRCVCVCAVSVFDGVFLIVFVSLLILTQNVFGRARCLEAALLTNPPPQLEGQIR